MTDLGARLPVGFRACTNAACGKPVHYKKTTCPHCQTVQLRIAADVAKVQPTADVVVHPSAPVAFVVEPYVVVQSFKQLLGNVVGEFKADMVLTDHALIQELLAAHSPICPVSQRAGMACCPHCHTTFALPVAGAGQKRAG